MDCGLAWNGRPGREGSRKGSALAGPLIWLLALSLFVAPFFGARQGPDAEGDDPGRLVSEIDIPFAEDLETFAEEFEEDLATPLLEASEAYFGLDAEGSMAAQLVDIPRVRAGERTYMQECAGCHGSTGNGSGPAAPHLDPRPRNFRRGLFKFTSTESGSKPLRADLFRTITRGLAGSSMPEFRLTPEEERWDVVEYVRYIALRGEFEQLSLDIAWEEEEVPEFEELAEIIAERWDEDELRQVGPPIVEPDRDSASVDRGRALFVDTAGANCVACHGATGIGDGPAAGDFTDDWGYPIVPRDLTGGVFRAGSSPNDLYRSIATGVNATPMTAFGGALDPEQIWDLVHFIQHLASPVEEN